mmetsp:Transcript_5885/g.17668  ORF Transcript_5885/g.17668 Transcript_5885/m.17668 type:complete len:202 (-) Transcript_5885:129-734(-)
MVHGVESIVRRVRCRAEECGCRMACVESDLTDDFWLKMRGSFEVHGHLLIDLATVSLNGSFALEQEHCEPVQEVVQLREALKAPVTDAPVFCRHRVNIYSLLACRDFGRYCRVQPSLHRARNYDPCDHYHSEHHGTEANLDVSSSAFSQQRHRVCRCRAVLSLPVVTSCTCRRCNRSPGCLKFCCWLHVPNSIARHPAPCF